MNGHDLYYKHLCIILNEHLNEEGLIGIFKVREIMGGQKINKELATMIIEEMREKGFLKRVITNQGALFFKIKKVTTL